MFLRSMKLQSLILFAVLFVCACQVSQKAQITELSNAANTNQITIANTPENKQTKIEKAKLADDSRFSATKIKRTERKNGFLLNIDLSYPQFKKAKTSQEIQFNQYVKRQVDEQIADFNNFLVNEKLKEIKDKRGLEFEINLDYEFQYVSENYLSVLMNWNGYSGYLNMDYFPSTINYDLRKGKAVELENVFETNSKYVEKLSQLAIEKLKRTCLSCPCKDGTSAGEPLPEGVDNAESVGGMFDLNEAVSPKEENFSNWSIIAEGLKITFNEYQVGPGCIGIIDIIIPFDDLQPILRKDLNFSAESKI